MKDRVGAGRSRHLKPAVGALVLCTAMGTVYGQINSWIGAASARWEDPFWSQGVLPTTNQTVLITNAGYKAVGISSSTAAGFPGSLVVSNLTILAPEDGLNTLLLNFSGTTVPLSVLSNCIVGTNGILLNLYSGVQVGGMIQIKDGQLIQEGGIAAVNGNVSLDGTMNVTNGTLSFNRLLMGQSSTNSLFTQAGGVVSGKLFLHTGTANLVGGIFSADAANVAGGDFNQYAGTNNSLQLTVGSGNTYPYYDTVFGSYNLFEGTLSVRDLNAGSGYFAVGTINQKGGVARARTLTVGSAGISSSGYYRLEGGELFCSEIDFAQGRLWQFGGRIVVTNDLILEGYRDDYDLNGSRAVSYFQSGGLMTSPSIYLGELGYVSQEGGTNSTGPLEINAGSVDMYGGTLETANTLLWKGDEYGGYGHTDFEQRGGTHKVAGGFTNYGNYYLSGGKLIAGSIKQWGTLYFSSLSTPGSPTILSNLSGILDLGGTFKVIATDFPATMALKVSRDSEIQFLGEPSVTVAFLNSSGSTWSNNAKLTVSGWSGSFGGGGMHRLVFGTSSNALSTLQVQAIWFQNPAGIPGLFPSRILASGEVVPNIASGVVGWAFSNFANSGAGSPNLSNIVAVAVGFGFGLALQANGTIVVWGAGAAGQLSVPPGLSNVVAIAAGPDHSLALKSDGQVVAWGFNYWGVTNVPAGLSNVVGISANEYHSIAVRSDGTAVVWGTDIYGQGVVPPGISNLTSVSAGRSYNLALKSDGTLTSWGYFGSTNIPAGMNNIVAISAGGDFNLALHADGTVRSWRNDTPATLIPGLSNAVAIAAGEGVGVALRADGSIAAWGGTVANPPKIPPLSNIVAVAMYGDSALLLIGNRLPQPFLLGSVQKFGTGQVRMNLTGPRAYQYEIESSLDLLHWNFLRNLAGESGTTYFTNHFLGNDARKFFRARRFQ